MEMNVLAEQAAEEALRTKKAYCKFLSAADLEEINSERNRFFISSSAMYLFFSIQELRTKGVLRKKETVKWQNNRISDCTFVWNAREKELWMAGIGDTFPFRDPKYTGALLVLVKNEDCYQGFVLNTDDSIQEFLGVFGLSSTQTDCVLKI